MARESIEERRARLAPGARWLAAERERRGLSGRELARRLGINPDRIFAYERAQDEPGKDFVALLAKEWGMAEADIWRNLHKDLPEEFEDHRLVLHVGLRRGERGHRSGEPASRPVRAGDPAGAGSREGASVP